MAIWAPDFDPGPMLTAAPRRPGGKASAVGDPGAAHGARSFWRAPCVPLPQFTAASPALGDGPLRARELGIGAHWCPRSGRRFHARWPDRAKVGRFNCYSGGSCDHWDSSSRPLLPGDLSHAPSAHRCPVPWSCDCVPRRADSDVADCVTQAGFAEDRTAETRGGGPGRVRPGSVGGAEGPRVDVPPPPRGGPPPGHPCL